MLDDDQIWGERGGRSGIRRICELDTRDVEDGVSLVSTLVGTNSEI